MNKKEKKPICYLKDCHCDCCIHKSPKPEKKVVKSVRELWKMVDKFDKKEREPEKKVRITKKQVLDWLFDHDRDLYYKVLNSR